MQKSCENSHVLLIFVGGLGFHASPEQGTAGLRGFELRETGRAQWDEELLDRRGRGRHVIKCGRSQYSIMFFTCVVNILIYTYIYAYIYICTCIVSLYIYICTHRFSNHQTVDSKKSTSVYYVCWMKKLSATFWGCYRYSCSAQDLATLPISGDAINAMIVR